LRKRAEALLEYLERDLKKPQGAFYAAEDADSEGVEGKFYVWTYSELEAALTASEFKKLRERFEIEEEGNWEFNTILHAHSDETDDFSEAWKKLLAIRSKRIRPLLDEKIITSWNGLMITSLAKYKSTRSLKMAKEAADFVLENLYSNKRLKRRWIQGEAKFEAQLEDYAYFIEGLKELYLSTMELKYLNSALELQGIVDQLFWREGKGYISNCGENVWRENQEFNDNVTPSAVTTTLLNLLWLGEIAQRDDLLEKAQKLSKDFPQSLLQFPLVYPRLIEFYDLEQSGIESVAILLDNESDRYKVQEQLSNYNPKRFAVASSNKDHPLLKDKIKKFSPATFYVCKNKSCQEAKANYGST
jgi:uncharacterized protein YyaL (SSP411 family)